MAVLQLTHLLYQRSSFKLAAKASFEQSACDPSHIERSL